MLRWFESTSSHQQKTFAVSRRRFFVVARDGEMRTARPGRSRATTVLRTVVEGAACESTSSHQQKTFAVSRRRFFVVARDGEMRTARPGRSRKNLGIKIARPASLMRPGQAYKSAHAVNCKRRCPLWQNGMKKPRCGCIVVLVFIFKQRNVFYVLAAPFGTALSSDWFSVFPSLFCLVERHVVGAALHVWVHELDAVVLPIANRAYLEFL